MPTAPRAPFAIQSIAFAFPGNPGAIPLRDDGKTHGVAIVLGKGGPVSVRAKTGGHQARRAM